MPKTLPKTTESSKPSETKPYPTKEMKELFKAILFLKDSKEAEKFFRDLLTISELKEFANRWKIAGLLNEKKSYLEVAKLTKSSTTTVSRVAHWLKHGLGGYRLILNRLSKKKR